MKVLTLIDSYHFCLIVIFILALQHTGNSVQLQSTEIKAMGIDRKNISNLGEQTGQVLLWYESQISFLVVLPHSKNSPSHGAGYALFPVNMELLIYSSFIAVSNLGENVIANHLWGWGGAVVSGITLSLSLFIWSNTALSWHSHKPDLSDSTT